MIGLVDNGRLVTLCLPGHVEHIVCRNLIGSSSHHLARETILTCRSHNRQPKDRVANLGCIVNLMHPAGVTTTMQTVRTIVLLQLNGVLAEDELTVLDAVCITTNT